VRKVTTAIIVVVVAALILWDVFVAITPEEGDTISEVIRDYGRGHPVIPYGLGVLSGHFFWPAKNRIHAAITFISLGSTGILLTALGLMYNLDWPAILVLFFGILVGHLVWAQLPAERVKRND